MLPRDLASLAKHLDADPAAERLCDGLPVWRIHWRSIDVLRRLQGQPRRDADTLLSVALGVLPLLGRSCYLMCEPDIDIHDLGPGEWRRVSPETWQVPIGIESHWLVDRGCLGQIGGFALYLRREPLPEGGYGREFGKVRTAEGFLDAMARLNIDALLEVGPDGTEWIVVLPTTGGGE